MENQNGNGTAPEQQQERTFTQEQVNAIVGKRLAEQKQQIEAEFVKRESELNKREMSIRAKELLSEKGLPKDLAAVLRYDDEETLVKAIESIEHVRGLNGKDLASDGQDKKVVEHRLERSTDFGNTSDPIADAFKREDG